MHTHSPPTTPIPLPTGAHWFLTPATPMYTSLCSIISCSITQSNTAAGPQTKDVKSDRSHSPLQKHENSSLLLSLFTEYNMAYCRLKSLLLCFVLLWEVKISCYRSHHITCCKSIRIFRTLYNSLREDEAL